MPPVPTTVKKGVHVLMARADGPEFTALDRKIFTVLLANAHFNISAGRKTMHHIDLSVLAQTLLIDFEPGATKEQFIVKVRESLERLWGEKISIDYTDAHGVEHTVKCHYLSYSISKLEATDLIYAFDEILLTFLWHPKVYAVVEIGVTARFQTTHGLRLYEVMKLHLYRDHKVWEVSVEEFRTYFELGDTHKRFEYVREHVIEKAVREVALHAEFDVQVEYVRSGRGGKVQLLRFKAVPKSAARFTALGADRAIGPSNKRPARLTDKSDAQTIDIFDGLTNTDKLIPPELSKDTIMAAAAILGGDEDMVLVHRDRWFDGVGRVGHLQPDQQFLAWLRHDRISRRDEPELDGVDIDALFVDLISDLEE